MLGLIAKHGENQGDVASLKPNVLRALDDPNQSVRLEALITIESLAWGDDAKPKLRQIVLRDDPPIASKALAILTAFNSDEFEKVRDSLKTTWP